MPHQITSTQSPRLARVRSLHDRKGRRESGLFIAEGPSLVRAALAAGLVEELWATEYQDFDADVIASEQVLRAAAETEHPQGVLAVCRQPTSTLTALWERPGQVLYLDRIADPGNLGTMIRTAAAVGAAGVILTPGCVDPFNGKVVRSSAGAICTVPIVTDVAQLPSGRTRYATVPTGGAPLFTTELDRQACWLIGSEAHGLATSVRVQADHDITIPMAEGTASLNAAIAAAICLYAADTPRPSASAG